MSRYIDADELKANIEQFNRPLCDDYHMKHYVLNQIITDIENQPTVDAVPVRHGKWIYGNDFHWYTASCSECGYQRRTDIKAEGWNQWKFCPMCGSGMDEERDSDHAEEEIL